MTQGWNSRCSRLGLVSALAMGGVIIASNCAFAQSKITPDNTLPTNSRVTSLDSSDVPVDRIDDGTVRGINLFHSFLEFNVDEGRGAYFTNPNGIENILSRVTGDDPSNILGTLGVLGNANLFFMNPNGILFGEKASLDVGGSFVATTANAIQLGNAGLFSASEPTTSNLLKVNPSALFFNAVVAQGIVNRSTATRADAVLKTDTGEGFFFNGDPRRSITGLQVLDGQGLLLVGGDVNLEGGNLTAAGGRVELGGVAESGAIGLDLDTNNLSLNFPDRVARADVSLTNGAGVSVAAGGGGSIAVNARNLDISEGGSLFAGISSGLGTAGSKAGDIKINAANRVRIEGEANFPSRIASLVGNSALGNAGDVVINTGSFEGIGSFAIGSSTFGQGDAGRVTITADDKVSFSGGGVGSGVASAVGPSALGNGADITINTQSLSLSNTAQLATSSVGQGNAGNIQVNASDFISVKDGSVLQAVSFFGQGNAGSVTIKGRNGSVPVVSFDGVGANGLSSTASTSVGSSPGAVSLGKGGNLSITARSLFITNGAQLRTDTSGQNLGQDAGDIRVDALESISVNGGSQLRSDTSGRGNAGGITIDAPNASVSIDGARIVNGSPTVSSIFSAVQPVVFEFTGDRQGGSIDIKAKSLSLTNGATLTASTFGKGDAGDMTIQADDISLDGVDSASLGNSAGGIFSNVEKGAEGKGGSIEVQADSLSLTNGAQIGTGIFGKGVAGSVIIQADDAIAFDGLGSNSLPSGVFSTVDLQGVGNGGNIDITTSSLSLTEGAEISASTFGKGDAGDMTIQAGDIFLDGVGGGSLGDFISGVFSNVEKGAEGKGGSIEVQADSLSLTNGAQIGASTFAKGDAGSVIIQADDAIAFDGLGSNGLPSGAFSVVSFGGIGDSSGIDITTGSLSLTEGAQIGTNTFAQGDAGDVKIIADDIFFEGVGSGSLGNFASGVFSNVAVGAEGQGGDITVTTGLLSLKKGAALDTETYGKADDTRRFDAGDIRVNVFDSLTVSGGSQLRSDTFGEGDAGNVLVDAEDATVFFDGGVIGSTVGNNPQLERLGIGKGGDIQIKAESLSLTNSAGLFSSTFGIGDAGGISVQVDQAVLLTNESYIRGSVEPGGTGKGADIGIKARSLSVTDGSQIGAFVSRTVTLPDGRVIPGGEGEGGNIVVNASDSTALSGIGSTGFSSGLLALSERGASGPAGNIIVSTGDFQVADGAVVAASTFNPGDGGSITINANTFEASGGGQVLTNTRTSGNAGNIKLNITDSIRLSGKDPNFDNRLILTKQNLQSGDQVSDAIVNEGSASGLFANTAPGSTGNSGSILVDPIEVLVTDSAQIAVDSQGQGDGGNLELQADSLMLDNGFISAATASGKGGIVTLKVEDLLQMRHESQMSAEAKGAANGGNVNINTDFLVAFPEENNDIIASASEGQGGNINITAQGIFGAQLREELTSLSDINASSEFGVDGVVELNTPDVEVQSSLNQLSANFISPEQVVAGSCLTRRNVEQGSFVVTGTGGLPRSPYEAISGRYNVTSVQPIQESSSASRDIEVVESTPWKKGDPIQEAQGMVVTADGRTIVGTTPQLAALAQAQTFICQSD